MESNPSRAQKKAKTSKRKQGECSQCALNRLDTWFTDESKKNDYKMIYIVKTLLKRVEREERRVSESDQSEGRSEDGLMMMLRRPNINWGKSFLNQSF